MSLLKINEAHLPSPIRCIIPTCSGSVTPPVSMLAAGWVCSSPAGGLQVFLLGNQGFKKPRASGKAKGFLSEQGCGCCACSAQQKGGER